MGNEKPKKKKKRIIILAAVVLIIGSGGAIYFTSVAKAAATASKTVTTPTKTTTLSKGELVESLSTSGTIYSRNTEEVYTTLSYTVKEIKVEIGDIVKKGDILAVLDTSTLKYDIEQAQINLNNAIKSSTETNFTLKNNIESANISVSTSNISLEKQQLNYDLLKEQINNKTDSELVSAQNSIDSANSSIETENQNMESSKLSVESAQLDLDLAKSDVDTKTLDYETNKSLFDSGIISKSDLDISERDLESSNASYQKSSASYEKAKSSYENSITNYENSKLDYDKAVANFSRVEQKLKNDLLVMQKDIESLKLSNKKSQNELNSAKEKSTTTVSSIESQQISLNELTEQLDKIEIKASIDGTITAVNTTVGSTPKDILFEIQDLNNLYVSTNIKELKIGKVLKGQDVSVTTQATDNKIMNGTVDFISQTSTSTSTTTDVEYEAKINMIDVDPNLKIGMNAFLNITLQSKKDIYSVPYDAIVYARGKGSSVYALVNNIVTELSVTTGMENDILTEISGDGIADGVIIITNPTTVTLGQSIDSETLTQNASNRNGNTKPTDNTGTAPTQGDTVPTGNARNQGNAAPAGNAGGAPNQGDAPPAN